MKVFIKTENLAIVARTFAYKSSTGSSVMALIATLIINCNIID